MNQLFQYNPTSEGNTEHGHKVTFRNDIMSILGLNSGYTAKYGLNPREFPRAAPSGTPLGSGHISSYIPLLVLIRIPYSFVQKEQIFKQKFEEQIFAYQTQPEQNFVPRSKILLV